MRSKFLLVMVILLSTMTLRGQEENRVLDGISGKLKEFREAFPLEKVTLLTDKEVYSPGAIVWFTTLVTDRSANLPSRHSPEITVKLYDASGNVIAGDRYLLSDGRSDGDLLLPDDLPLGRYYLAAYTPLQANPENVYIKPLIVDRFYESDALVTFAEPSAIHAAGREAAIVLNVTDYSGNPADRFQLIYELRQGGKKLADGKVRSDKGKAVITAMMPPKTGSIPVELLVSHPKNLWTRKLTLLTDNDEIQVRFYPEGGHLTGTTPQKMGFYATARDGVPVELDGDVVDSGGEIVARAKSFAPGYGLFPFKGTAGGKYHLVVTSEYGKGQRFVLPDTEEDQLALMVQKTDTAWVTADLITAPVATPRKLAVTATRGAMLLWAANIEVSSTARIRIPVSQLESGLIQLSVFDASAKPLSSRLVYIAGKKKLSVKIDAERSGEEHVKITVLTTDENRQPVDARVILSVADKMRRTLPPHALSSYTDLNSELRNPAPPLVVNTADLSLSGVALDYTLICNDLRCFSWDKVLSVNELQDKNLLNSMGLSGRVTDKKGNALSGAKVSIMDLRDMQLFSAVAGDDGRFEIPAVQPVDISDFNISATDAHGKGNFQVTLDPLFAEKVGMKVSALDHACQRMEAPRENIAAYLSANAGLLAPQPAFRPIAAGGGTRKEDSYKRLLQNSTSLLEVIKSMRPFTLINGQIVFPGTMNSINAQTGALIVVDGQKMGTQVDILNSISTFDVDKINISTDPMDIQKYTGLNNVGVIEITTRRGEIASTPEGIPEQEVLHSDGYRVPRNFLTTDALESGGDKDLRTTLFWDTALRTGTTGTKVFSVPLSDIRSGFIIRADAVTGEMVTGTAVSEF